MVTASGGATTGSAGAQLHPALPQPQPLEAHSLRPPHPLPNRLHALGYPNQPPLASTRRTPWVLRELTPRMRLLIDYMVFGCPHEDVARRIGRGAGEPLTLLEASDLLHLKRRQARDLTRQAVFQKAHAQALHAFREGHKAEAERMIVQIMRAEGEGKAADRKVQLEAAKLVLGEGGNGPLVQINNNQTNVSTGGAPLVAGIVIRVPAEHSNAGPTTIDATAIPDTGDTTQGIDQRGDRQAIPTSDVPIRRISGGE